MTPRWRFSLCASLLLAIASPNPIAAQAASPAAHPDSIYFTVTGKGDHPPDPVQADFSVSLDKHAVPITALRPATDKLLFALVIDTSTTDTVVAREIRDAAIQIFQSLAAEGNQGYVAAFATPVAMTNNPVDAAEAGRRLNAMLFGGGSSLYDAVSDSCTMLLSRAANPASPRRAIILISAGNDDQSRASRSAAIEAAQREGIAVFSISTEVSVSHYDHWESIVVDNGPGINPGTLFLRDLSHSTGGQAWFQATVRQSIEPLLAALHRQWALDLALTQAPDGKLHALSVRSSQKDLEFYAPTRIPLP
jgi:Ca-activated chloride channel family protein